MSERFFIKDDVVSFISDDQKHPDEYIVDRVEHGSVSIVGPGWVDRDRLRLVRRWFTVSTKGLGEFVKAGAIIRVVGYSGQVIASGRVTYVDYPVKFVLDSNYGIEHTIHFRGFHGLIERQFTTDEIDALAQRQEAEEAVGWSGKPESGNPTVS